MPGIHAAQKALVMDSSVSPALPGNATAAPYDDLNPSALVTIARCVSLARRERRLHKYQEVLDQHNQGVGIPAICRHMRMSRRTVKRWPEPFLNRPNVTPRSPSMHSFPRSASGGIKAPMPAVRAAMAHRWSNGRSEGHVNHIKMIMRKM